MSIPLPKFRFLPDRSTPRLLVFEITSYDVNGYSGPQKIAQLEVSVYKKECKLTGLGNFSHLKIIPPELYGLESEKRQNIIESEYRDYSEGFLSQCVCSKTLKIFKYSESMNYLTFVKWLESGMLGMVEKLS